MVCGIINGMWNNKQRRVKKLLACLTALFLTFGCTSVKADEARSIQASEYSSEHPVRNYDVGLKNRMELLSLRPGDTGNVEAYFPDIYGIEMTGTIKFGVSGLL